VPSFASVAEAIRFAPRDCVYAVAVPAPSLLEVLALLPDAAAVIMQKPMGETLAEAQKILELCRCKRLVAAVNFQLCWAPNLHRASQMYRAGELGDLHDFQIDVSCRMPWENWSFLAQAPRLEILYHSIHYLDLARAWLGDPIAVQARTVRSPRTPTLAATKSSIVLDYGDWTRALIATDHSNNYGAEHERSFVQVEGTAAAIHARIGGNLNYPQGLPDTLDVGREGTGWQPVPIAGSWFPHAFAGSMGSLQRFVEGTSVDLPTSVEDAIRTMALVEACYESSRTGAAVRLTGLVH